MAFELARRRAGWPAFAVLTGLLLGVLYVALRARDVGGGPSREGPYIGPLTAGPDAAGPDADAGSVGTWRHHAWWSDAGAARPADPSNQDAFYDPQRSAMGRAFPVDGGVALPFEPIDRPARVLTRSGTLTMSPDAACELRVLPMRGGPERGDPYDCLVRVLCAGQVLYPNESQTGGYVSCRMRDGRPVGATDDGFSGEDRDPRLELDLEAGTVTVEDQGARTYRVTLRF